MKRYMCFLTILLSLLFVFSSCDSPSGSKPDAVTKPSLISPNDNATNISTNPTFKWNGEADKLEVSSNITFSQVVYSATVSGQTHTMPAGYLGTNSRYYWHAGKTSGSDIYWSDEKFTFVTAP